MEEARAFLRDLTEHATQRRFVYTHVWQPWDLVMWDNRCTMHLGPNDYDGYRREMYRTTTAGTKPFSGPVPRRW